jgi:hypothetical protein
MASSGIRSVDIDPANRSFKVSGSFLTGFEEKFAVRYVGRESSVTISAGIEVIATGCFSDCPTASSVVFEAGCRISNLGGFAFCDCGRLQSICIPSSIASISEECFSHCVNLSSLTFESGSRVSNLGDYSTHFGIASPLDPFAFLHQLKLPFGIVSHFSRFAFLRQLKQFGNAVFLAARAFRA